MSFPPLSGSLFLFLKWAVIGVLAFWVGSVILAAFLAPWVMLYLQSQELAYALIGYVYVLIWKTYVFQSLR